MYKSFLIVLLFFLLSWAQNERKQTAQIWDDWGTYATDEDSIWFESDSGFIYIANAETLYIFIPTGRSYGTLWIHGTVTALDTLFGASYSDYEGGATDSLAFCGADSLIFQLASHTGDGTALKTDETETYIAMDTVNTSTTGTFSIWPMKNSILKSQACEFFTLRILSKANNFGAVWIEVEHINTYNKYR
jgi:hypothetical protein